MNTLFLDYTPKNKQETEAINKIGEEMSRGEVIAELFFNMNYHAGEAYEASLLEVDDSEDQAHSDAAKDLLIVLGMNFDDKGFMHNPDGTLYQEVNA